MYDDCKCNKSPTGYHDSLRLTEIVPCTCDNPTLQKVGFKQ